MSTCEIISNLFTVETIGNWIAFGTAIAAIVGLFYQSLSTRKQLKLSNFFEYTKRYQEIVLEFPEGINKCDFKISALPPEKKDRTMRYMRAYMDLCFEEYTLKDKKYIDKDLWSIWEGGMKTAFSKAAFTEAWSAIRKDTEYGEKFETFVDKLQKDTPSGGGCA